MAVDTEYEEDARRIEREYVDPTATTEAEIENELRNADFAEDAVEDIKDWILNTEDVGGPALDPHSDGVTTREQIEQAVEQADSVGFSESRKDSVTSEIAQDVGAPTESELRGAQARAIGGADDVTPEGTTTTVSLIRGTDGEPAAVVGGTSRTGPEAAEEFGVDHYSSPQEFSDSMSVQAAPDGSRGLLYANGNAVEEVSLE